MTDSIASISQSQTAAAATAKTAAADQASLVKDYSDFLTLLTAQLQNQNPLEPMDSKEFTNQLTQFSGVEQSIQSNKLLEQLISSSQNSQATSLVSYLGNTITAEGNSTRLENGAANWKYDVGGEATTAEISVRNSAGAVVYKETITTQQGVHNFNWDGKTKTGSQNPDGIYSLSVTATNDDGQVIPVSTEISGRVDGVDMTGAVPTLAIGSATFPVSAVKSVSTS